MNQMRMNQSVCGSHGVGPTVLWDPLSRHLQFFHTTSGSQHITYSTQQHPTPAADRRLPASGHLWPCPMVHTNASTPGGHSTTHPRLAR
jgi:hypothetical protein